MTPDEKEAMRLITKRLVKVADDAVQKFKDLILAFNRSTKNVTELGATRNACQTLNEQRYIDAEDA